MESLKYFTKMLYYIMAILVLIYVSISLDEIFFEGKIRALVSTVESSVMIQYADSKFKFETYVGFLQADSTHLSMQLKWTI